MRIAYWVPAFLPDIGGMEVLAAKTLPIFKEMGYEPIIITAYGSYQDIQEETEYKGIPIYRFHFREALGNKDLAEILKIKHRVSELIDDFKPDLTHFNFSDPWIYFHLSTTSAQAAPTITTLHRSVEDFSTTKDSALGKLLRSSAWVCGVSKIILDDAREALPEIRERSSVIYNGLETPDVVPTDLPFDHPKLFCLGRIIPDKGFDLAIKAFAIIHKQYPELRMVVAGDGFARKELQALTQELGVSEKVVFPGWVDPEVIPDLLNQATIVIIPSRWREPFPLVALQTGQMARPAVATRAGGLPEAIMDGKTGYLFEMENVEEIVSHLCALLDEPQLAQKMGDNARSHILREFSIEKFIQSYDQLYKKIGNNDG